MKPDTQSQVPNAYKQQPVYEDEFNLIDIVQVLFRRKKLILLIAILIFCIGIFYSFSVKQVYEVKTIILPPSLEDIQPLTVLNSSSVNSNDVFSSFIGNLNSRKLRKKFFDEFRIQEVLSDSSSSQLLGAKEIDALFEDFSKRLTVKTEKGLVSANVTLEGINKDKIGGWLDDFVTLGDLETKNQLERNFQANLNSKIKNLKINISSKRSIYKLRRKDELARMNESLKIAKSLAIHEYNSIVKIHSKNTNLSIYMQDKKMYMLGTKVLQAEIKALKNRKSDDIYIEGLRDLQEQLTKLESIKLDKSKLHTVIVDKKAIINFETIRPNKKLIILISLIFGGILGIFTAFIMEFINNFKRSM